MSGFSGVLDEKNYLTTQKSGNTWYKKGQLNNHKNRVTQILGQVDTMYLFVLSGKVPKSPLRC